MAGLQLRGGLDQRLRALVDAAQALDEGVGRIAGIAAGTAPETAVAARFEAPGVVLEVGTAAATSPVLTQSQRRICERVINVFETGTPDGRYGAISIFHDGPNRIRQITYGRSQTTEYGNLRELVQMYVDAGGSFSEDLRPYVASIGQTPLVDNARFKDLLRRAGNEDTVMRHTQDVFFDRRYFQPALRWAGEHGFTYALSILVIYDSFIHSGSIRDDLRSRFSERPPAAGGDEKTWIRQYVDVRHEWLTHHDNPEVRPSNYRTRDLAREIGLANWDLGILPFMANGVPVREMAVSIVGTFDHGGTTSMAPPFSETGVATAFDFDDGEVWSEVELPPAAFAMFGVAELASGLAARILSHGGIKLADAHVSGIDDRATARRNIEDTAAGGAARRSAYGTAPGGTVALDTRLLNGLLALASEFTFTVSELAGGSHNSNSRHYAGVAADIGVINGHRVSASHPDVALFRQRCRDLGATEVLGPGQPGHATHIHAAWPRPA